MAGKSVFAKTLLAAVMLGGGLVLGGSDSEPVLEKEWELKNFMRPESAEYDPSRNLVYISNVNGDSKKKDGNGFISRVSPDGLVVQPEWVIGLDGPKGMAVVGDRLFVSDIDRLIEIDITKAKVSKRYRAKDAKFLNDVAAEWSRNHQQLFPVDRRPLKRRQLNLDVRQIPRQNRREQESGKQEPGKQKSTGQTDQGTADQGTAGKVVQRKRGKKKRGSDS